MSMTPEGCFDWAAVEDQHLPRQHKIDECRRENARELARKLGDESLQVVTIPRTADAYVIIGAPGAGKTHLGRMFAEQKQAILVDAEDTMKFIPEYKGDYRSAMAVFEEAVHIAHQLGMETIIARADDLVWTCIGANIDVLRQRIRILKDNDYRVHLIHARCPTAVAVRRCLARWKDPNDGRFVDPAYILQIADLPSRSYETLKSERIEARRLENG